jgi:rRNA maturation endonuclease Nob1
MKKAEIMPLLRAFMAPLYDAIPHVIDWNPCPGCGRKITYPDYVWLKIAFCPHCGELRQIGGVERQVGNAEAYGWVQ